MPSFLVQTLQSHGSLALFGLLALGLVGLPVPGETLLVFSGVLVAQGTMHLVPTYLGASLGSTLGVSISYSLGRIAGPAAVSRYGRHLRVSTQDLARVRHLIERAGKWGLVFGYFIPGVRHLTALVAGATEVRIAVFAMFGGVGAALWSLTFITIGYYAGDRWREALSMVSSPVVIAGMVIVAAVAVVVLWRKRWEEREVRSEK
jgi:membrane protein DedA with SNARE-associated domain